MKLKNVIGVSFVIFGTSVAIILVVGLVLVQPTGAGAALTYVTDPATGQSVAVDPGTGQVAPTPQSPDSASVSSAPSPSATANIVPKAGTSGVKTPVPATPVPVAQKTPTPVPTLAACGAAGGVCSPAQVAAHNTQASCWVIYGGYYYNVTSYVSVHSGGRAVFNSATCGHDITSYMAGALEAVSGKQFAHPTSAYNTLASYKIGPVR